MDPLEKLKILANSAKYDVSCSSSGSSRANKKNALGHSVSSGICHSWSDDGRCISLFKILLTNVCVYDCIYCVNRSSNDVPRATFTPQEIVNLTMNFYRRNYIEGLFLSSAILQSPNYTMELLLKTVKKLRLDEQFNGYIHLKAIPGADLKLIEEAGKYVDRMSVNIELPSNQSLKILAPQKKKDAILKPMGLIRNRLEETLGEKKQYSHTPKFVPAGQTTQLIIGATPDTDLKILSLSESLYEKLQLKRVYYSAYVPIVHHRNLPSIQIPPLLREHRLYQADWLLRFYGFNAQELLDEIQPNFDTSLDPKSDWALRNIHRFPLEINRADYELLLRVPGIGVKSAQRIMAARRFHSLTYEDLKKMGIVLKRAKHFITCKGVYYGGPIDNTAHIRSALLLPGDQKKSGHSNEQFSLFTLFPHLFQRDEIIGNLTGEF